MTKEQEYKIKFAIDDVYNKFPIYLTTQKAIFAAIKTYHELMTEEAKKTAEAFEDLDIEKQAYDKGFREGKAEAKKNFKKIFINLIEGID